MNTDNLWNEFLDKIKERIIPLSYDTWFKDTKLYKLDGGTATIIVPLALHKKHLEENYIDDIEETFNSITGTNFNFKFILENEINEISDNNEEVIIGTSYENMGVPHQTSASANLNSEYTFDSFIVGNSNRFAFTAARAVAEKPGKAYNPLFLYGKSGLGKTHLMHAIGNYIIQNTNKKVLYVSSEQFVNDYIAAVRNNEKNTFDKIDSFKNKYRNIDVLIIDDIQFLGSATKGQEEFFHTFNDLHSNKKQIIISSDRPPREIETLEDRLRSRFEWGLTVDIQPPDYETRMAILRKKEELEGYNIDNEIIKYIATNVKSNIRELEGALTKIVASSKLNNKEINLELAEEALKDLISPNAAREVTPQLIINVVSEHFGITPLDLIGQKRSKELVFPRQIVMYLCGDMTSESLQNIGKALGGRDHTTIIHGTKKIASELKTDENLKNTIDILKKKINPQ